MAMRDEIKMVIGYMKLAFPNYRPELEGQINTLDVLTDLLGDLPKEALWAAVKSCCAEPGRAFAPSAGEIRGKVAEIHAKAAGMPSAGEAWGAVIGSFERMPGGNMAGGGHGGLLDNPLVQEAVGQMGGYGAIDYENQMAGRAHFLKIYTELQRRALADAAELPQVTAYIESRQLEAGKEIKQLTDRMEAK